MKKFSVLFASFLLSLTIFAQQVVQKQVIHSSQNLTVTKQGNSAVDFNQLARDLEATATKTPDGLIRCFTTENMEMLNQKYNGAFDVQQFEDWIAPKIQEYNDRVINGLATQKVVVTIPVIMHIIHNSTEGVGTGRNISQAQATSQITILNNDFRKLNADTTLIPAAFKPLAADLEVNFVPALRYASNHALAGQTLAEPGIERISAATISGLGNTTTGYSTGTTGQIETLIKPNTYWNRTEVMNIWVCQIAGGILGYAQFPTGSGLAGLSGGATGANTDGLVLTYTATGTGGVAAAPYNKGRTATHEIGHWLGLRHIWGDEAACGADDFVTDTPQQKDKNYGCPSYPQTTGTGGRCSTADPSSMYMNYMDYTDDACMMMFTQGQKARVVTVLANSPGRVELPTSTLGSPLATTAQFSGTPTSIPVGNSVTFTDQSISPNTITTWNWTFTGGTPSSFVGQNPPAITYNAAGNYTVSLTITDNLSGTDVETKTNYINVFTAGVCDTLNYPPSGTVVAYTTGAGQGYLIGSNQYLDKGKAEYISSAAHAPYTHVTGGRFAVRSARDGGNGATVTFNVWDATGTGGSPGAILGSVTVPLASLNTNPTGYENNIQQIMFPTAINVGTAPYYFGFVMNNFKTTNPASTKDTLGLFSNTDGDSSPGTAWEQQSDNLWYDVTSVYGINITSYLSPIMSQNAPGPVLTTNTTSICPGGSVNFNASTSTNTLSYNWVFNGGSPGTSTSATQTVSYAAAGSQKAYLTLTGNCGAVSKDSVTITINSNNTVGAASSTPTVCINTAITNITHATTGATGIGSATGLPAGVTANWAGNTITISGTPTASGTFNYTIPLTGGCGTFNATGTITVTPNKTVGAASSTPTVCINTAITPVTHTTTGATGIGAATGLPAGVTANYSAGTITISGTPSASGTFNYTIPLTGGCGTASATGIITVTSSNTVGIASSSPSVCINTAITAITHTTTGATGIGAATGLPAGVSAIWAGNTITISGTPTVSGTFNYTIPLTGGCGASVSATGTITVTSSNTVGAASSTPTVCINTAITNITHATTGGTGIGSATGLPSGVTASWVGNTITISGTPTTSGTFNYTIPLTGGCGASVSATGTITVTSSNTVGAASSTPSVCINTAITNITHATTGATGIGSATGLPAGVNASWAGNTITISGSPTASGTFNYSIPLTGGCGTFNATGTITVTPNKTVGAASSSPSVCINTTITPVTHTTTGATGIGSTTGLPAGVTANYSAGTITISGTPSATGTFNYTIPLTGGCGSANATGTITVTSTNTVGSASSTPTVCVNNTITAVTHTTTGATGIGSATGLPAGVNASWAGNTITISGTPTATGTFNYTIPLTGGCGASVSATGTITVNPSVTPTFTAVGSYCSGSTIPALPTTSTNGVTGTWSPAINNTATTTYTFTPNAGQCATTTSMVITINPASTPTFAAVGPYCSGATIAALPTTSTNGVTGTWSPAIDNTTTTTYTFTPDAGQCATTSSMVITINNPTTPTFAAAGPYCSGSTIPALPTTSTNGVNGTWSPAINNTATTTYTFTPNAGQCATNTTITLVVTPVINIQESTTVCNFGSYTFPDGTTQNNITSQVVHISTLTSSGGCDSLVETTVNVQICTGVNEVNQGFVQIYPNPVRSMLTINLVNKELTSVKLINILGEVLVNKIITSSTTSIPVEKYPKGVYFIQLFDNDGSVSHTEKIIVN